MFLFVAMRMISLDGKVNEWNQAVEVFEKPKKQLESATSCRFIEMLKIESDRFNVSLTFEVSNESLAFAVSESW